MNIRSGLPVSVLSAFCLMGSMAAIPTEGRRQDVPVVSNPADPAYPSGKRIRLVFKEELTVGVEEGDGNYMFGGSIEATADKMGNMYVLDWAQKRIQKYDPSGKYLLTIGRKGQGPGEFGNIWMMRFDGKGRIYATDIVNRRVSFFDTETGEYREAAKMESGVGGVTFLSNGTAFTYKDAREDTPTGSIFTLVWGIYGPDFKLLTEFRKDQLDMTNLPDYGEPALFLAGIMSRNAFKPTTATAVTPDERIIVGFPEQYEFDVYDGSGRRTLKIRRAWEPLPVTDRHKDYFFETSVLDFLASSRVRPKDEDVRKAMVYPKFLPAYQTIIPMENGFFFVVTDTLADVSTVDLFDAKGVYAGHFTTEAPAATLLFKNGKAYGVGHIGDYRCLKRYTVTTETY
jgi:hypothetical protein